MLEGRFTFRVEGGANFATDAHATTRWAMFSGVVDDLNMHIVPCFFRKETFEVFFGLLDALSIGETPALRKSVDMGIYGKGRDVKGL